ncbi:hypothetical protein RYX36_019955 [Vicia faba]
MSNLFEQISSSSDSVNNLNSLLSSFTPLVNAKFSYEKTCDSGEKPYFILEDLWESFKEWSAFGVEVQFTLNDEQVLQYFVPYLSAIQLYVEDEGLEYPIYRIPNGPTLKNIEASFLTYHNLSTQPEMRDRKMKTPLPIFGLTTYKVRGSILPFPEASQSCQLNSLLKAADGWLKNLKVRHYDHNHFVQNGKQWVD